MGDEIGAIAVGQKADLVLYDLTNLSLLPRTDPIGLLILGRPTQVVHSVWIDGKQIVVDGKVKTINVDGLRQELFNRSQWYNNLQFPSISTLEERYRTVMSLPDKFSV